MSKFFDKTLMKNFQLCQGSFHSLLRVSIDSFGFICHSAVCVEYNCVLFVHLRILQIERMI